MTSRARQLVVSLHDITPFHRDRIRRAETVYRELGLSKIAYLFVPEYHGGYPAAEDAGFRAWCREERPFRIDWHLHGYHHLESLPRAASGEGALGEGALGEAGSSRRPDGPAQGEVGPPQREGGGAGDFLKRKLLTAGEGEFLALDAATQRRKLEAGRAAFRACLGKDPVGFVAPAWLFNARLPGELRAQGFRFTEDQRRMYRVDTGAILKSPVITWATRTWMRKYGSLLVCPLLLRLWSRVPVLRIAMHPFDFDHPETVANIRSVLAAAMRDREQVFAEDLEFGPPGAG